MNRRGTRNVTPTARYCIERESYIIKKFFQRPNIPNN